MPRYSGVTFNVQPVKKGARVDGYVVSGSFQTACTTERGKPLLSIVRAACAVMLNIRIPSGHGKLALYRTCGFRRS